MSTEEKTYAPITPVAVGDWRNMFNDEPVEVVHFPVPNDDVYVVDDLYDLPFFLPQMNFQTRIKIGKSPKKGTS